MAILIKRDNSPPPPPSRQLPDPLVLITILFLLICLIAICGITLFVIRRYRREIGNKNRPPLTISTAAPWGKTSHSDMEKQALMGSASPSPITPDSIPEIRITFPEEEDAQGRRMSGRVVIVQVGEAGVGFVRPVPEDQLPPYHDDGFSLVDLEKIGGLKETNSKNIH